MMAGGGRGIRAGIIPGQPVRRVRFDLVWVSGNGHQILEGIDCIEPAGMDEAHEQVAGLGAVEGLVAEAVFAVENGHF